MPAREPHLTVRAIRPFVSGLGALGHDAGPLLSDAGFDAALLNDPDVRIPMRVVARLVAGAVERTRDPNLGLHLAQRADLGSADVHFYAMLTSPTLGAAYGRLARYQRLIEGTGHLEVTIGPERATLSLNLPDGLAATPQTAEFAVASWVRAGRMITGMEWAPLEVHFAHQASSNPQDHVRFFRSPVRFGMPGTRLLLARSLLDAPCVRADDTLMAVLERYAHDRLDAGAAADDIVDRVRSTLADELKGGEPTAAALAARLKMSPRTLSRHLAAAGTSFHDLLEGLRRELALRHLAGDQLSIAEIAFLLGFADLKAFHRAFKRWTGEKPAEFRKKGTRE
jgi:AraC-like DNA-binding protein